MWNVGGFLDLLIWGGVCSNGLLGSSCSYFVVYDFIIFNVIIMLFVLVFMLFGCLVICKFYMLKLGFFFKSLDCVGGYLRI